MSKFYQQAAELGNQYLQDQALRALLQRRMPGAVLQALTPDFTELGELAAGTMLQLAADAESHPPELLQFDPWGRRIDQISTAAGWQALHDLAASQAVVASAYQRQHGRWSRLQQMVRLYLYHPSSAVASCPLAMTDGAARLLELHAGDCEELQAAFGHLVSTDPDQFWTAGQWMTERTGGSDVSTTTTLALADADAHQATAYRLHGDKWFTSATTAQVAMTLARVREEQGTDDHLSLFYLPVRDQNQQLNNIIIHRLKDKLGTHALPTAELTMQGSRAILIGARGQGVKTIATMLNITRLYNACCAAAIMRRAVALAEDYADKRQAFGRSLAQLPLHAETLADLHCEQRAAMTLVMYLAELLGQQECGCSSAAENLILRVLVPVAKLYTGKQAIAVTSEVLECFGGAGYIENTGLPVMLRDAQVLSIWEGTTNVLSLDLLRALRDAEAWPVLRDQLRQLLAQLQADLQVQRQCCVTAIDRLNDWLCEHHEDELMQRRARRLAFAFARISAAVLLLQQCDWCQRQQHADTAAARAAAERWCSKDLLAGLMDQQQ